MLTNKSFLAIDGPDQGDPLFILAEATDVRCQVSSCNRFSSHLFLTAKMGGDGLGREFACPYSPKCEKGFR